MAYGDFKDLPKTTTSDKESCFKDQEGLASMIYKVFDKKSATHKKQ